MADRLTPKERMRRTLERRPVDRLPVQTNYTAAMGAKLAACFQCAPSELPARLDNHLLRLDVTHTPRVSRDGRVRFDWWGAGWGTETEGYWHAHAPLAESTDLAAYSWPDPHAPGLLADAENTVAADGGQHFAVPNFGFALFERAWSLRGFDLLLMDMVDRPAWVEELLDRITEIQISLARRFLALGRHEHGEAPPSKSETRDPKSETDPSLLTSAASEARLRPNPVCVFPPFSPGRLDRTRRGPRSLESLTPSTQLGTSTCLQHISPVKDSRGGVDGGYFGDDYGAQRGLLFSPKLWRAMIKPRLARMFAVFRAAGLPVMLHSDGDIWPILPDLVDIGLTCLNPVQPEVLEHTRLHREFGQHLSFYGGISTQEVLPKVTPAEVRAATRACVRDLAPDGTGLILGPSHRMQSDIPMENVVAMLEAFPASSDRS